MDPKAIPAALRDFAAAAATSPDAAKSVADLALLIAELFDQVSAAVEAETKADTRFAFTTEHDDLAFPPLQPIVATMAGHDFTESDLSELAREAAGMAPEVWAALPAEEQALHRTLALSKLRQEHAADTAA